MKDLASSRRVRTEKSSLTPAKHILRKKKRGEFEVKLHEFDGDDAGILGRVKIEDRIVRINKHHPFIRECLDQPRDLNLIVVAATGLWGSVSVMQATGGQGRMIDVPEYIEKMSNLLRNYKLRKRADAE